MPISVASPRSARRLGPALRTLIRDTLARVGRKPGEIAVQLTDDATLRDLNRRWRGIDRATDVLSFSYSGENGEGPVSGDLVISLDRMAAQARRYRVTPGRELARLVIHGTLHLAGLDHHRAAEREHMRRRENAALRAVATVVRQVERALASRDPSRKAVKRAS